MAHSTFSQASGFRPAPERLASPLSARGPSGNVGPRTAAMRQRGIVSDWRVRGKRKVCEGMHRGAHTIHSFSTSTNFVQSCKESRFFPLILAVLTYVRERLHRYPITQPEE